MAISQLSDIGIAGVAVCVPSQTEDNLLHPSISAKDRNLYVQSTGIRFRRIAPDGVSAADLCRKSAERLLEKLNWDKASISLLIFISQTPDYLIPNTSGILQNQLGLSKNCLAFDVNLGCSGYVYGLQMAMAILKTIPNGRALLLVGDVSSKCISHEDKSVSPLFSDAGSATALKYEPPIRSSYHLQSDGNGWDAILIPDGGMRSPFSLDSLTIEEPEPGIKRNRLQMRLDGISIFHFAQRELAANIQDLLKSIPEAPENIHAFFFHQANKLILDNVRKKLGLPAEKVPLVLEDFGNASSASIPLTMVIHAARQQLQGKKVLLCGFGVGLSWGSCVTRIPENCIFEYLEWNT